MSRSCIQVEELRQLACRDMPATHRLVPLMIFSAILNPISVFPIRDALGDEHCFRPTLGGPSFWCKNEATYVYVDNVLLFANQI
ncbi:Carboxypeptidase A [Echinococcus multilocularis]|uniref:Carboxypeptidase A n=1 Tax=Echinococcus multilocularis TaxID=6211 RepID=A0A0S4MM63_ECHMU|nr:Carboxypeptidase A [Echinococcus multilocularis]